MRVSLHSGSINAAQVTLDLTCDGLVVLETMRPHAESIAAAVRRDIAESYLPKNEDDAPPAVHHLSCRTPDGGFVDYLCMASVFGHDALRDAPEVVLKVVDEWRRGAPRDRFLWRSRD